ncbi:MAG: TlpA family protein disulfide reductase [Bacteroidia bacterium]|nr:TlpA family protein disulfide reductase [Bacteroidia bacterium]
MKTDCDKYTTAGIVKSKMNQEYQDFLKERNALNKQSTEAIKSYRVTKADNITKKDSLNQLLAQIDQARLDLPKTFKNDFVRKIAQLFTYQSYQNHGGEYDVEIEYFADNYFANADLSDPMYNQISVVYEVFKNYTSTLTKAKLQSKVHSDYIEKRLSKLDQNGMAYKYALGAVVNTLFNADHKNMPHFASRYVNKYYDEDKAELGQMKLVVDQINANTIGAEAPDIVLNSPEDKELALSELKGKIVLIDFWASWCGPCRRENPNVVRMYDKYKDKGFEIYGVSLDSKKDRWVSAIEADGLTWPNVSDLKGWQSYAAKMYAVRSIPTTVLIDKEGKILARNLRGPTLEAKLEELFN